MYMINRYAEFHVDIQSGYRRILIPVSVIELLETANFVYNFV